MKKKVLVLLLLWTVTAFTEETGEEKLYLMPGQLSMDAKGLYVEVEGNLCPVESVHVDSRGVYVSSSDYIWKCPECKKPNPNWFSFCAWCGKPKEKSGKK